MSANACKGGNSLQSRALVPGPCTHAQQGSPQSRGPHACIWLACMQEEAAGELPERCATREKTTGLYCTQKAIRHDVPRELVVMLAHAKAQVCPYHPACLHTCTHTVHACARAHTHTHARIRYTPAACARTPVGWAPCLPEVPPPSGIQTQTAAGSPGSTACKCTR